MNDQDILSSVRSRNHFYENIECLDNHLSKYFPNNEMVVFHEMGSLDFHLDVYFIKPSNTDFAILITSGMSLLEMTVDSTIQDGKSLRFAELMVLVPKDMEFATVYTGDEKNSWVITMLKRTARFPHHYDTFICSGQTIQATDDMKPYDGATEFVGCAFMESVTFDTDFTKVICGDNTINIYSLFPLYKNELEYKVKTGYAGLVNLMNKSQPKEIIDIGRNNLIDSRKSWNVFKRR